MIKEYRKIVTSICCLIKYIITIRHEVRPIEVKTYNYYALWHTMYIQTYYSCGFFVAVKNNFGSSNLSFYESHI